MKRTNEGLIWLAGAIVLMTCADVLADAKANPYDPIVERNPFGLKPPPPPEDPSTKVPPAPPAPPATVELTGITTILSSKKALLEIVPGPGKPMIRRIAVEGERFDSIEVVSIDVDKNQVVVKNGSVITNLTFRVAKSTPGPVAPGGVPLPIPGGVPPPAPAQTTHNYNQNYSGSGRNNVMVSGGNSAAPASGFPGNAALGAANPGYGGLNNNAGIGNVPTLSGGVDNSGFRSIPSRNIRGNPQNQRQLSPEEHVMQIEENERLNTQSGRIVPPLPPTPLNPVRTPILPPLPGQK